MSCGVHYYSYSTSFVNLNSIQVSTIYFVIITSLAIGSRLLTYLQSLLLLVTYTFSRMDGQFLFLHFLLSVLASVIIFPLSLYYYAYLVGFIASISRTYMVKMNLFLILLSAYEVNN